MSVCWINAWHCDHPVLASLSSDHQKQANQLWIMYSLPDKRDHSFNRGLLLHDGLAMSCRAKPQCIDHSLTPGSILRSTGWRICLKKELMNTEWALVKHTHTHIYILYIFRLGYASFCCEFFIISNKLSITSLRFQLKFTWLSICHILENHSKIYKIWYNWLLKNSYLFIWNI